MLKLNKVFISGIITFIVTLQLVSADPFDQFVGTNFNLYNLAADLPGALPGYKYLDGAVFCCDWGHVYLSPQNSGGFTGTKWTAVSYGANRYSLINTAGYLPGASANNYLGCNYANGNVYLTNNGPRDRYSTDSYVWEVTKHGENDYSFNCVQQFLFGSGNYLDAAVFPGSPGSVYMTQSTGNSGTHWKVIAA